MLMKCRLRSPKGKTEQLEGDVISILLGTFHYFKGGILVDEGGSYFVAC